MYSFSFNGQESENMNFSIAKRHILPIPKKRYKDYKITGRSGNIYEDLNEYEDLEISLDCNFSVKKNRNNWDWENEYNEHIDWLSNWLYNIKDNRLNFSDAYDYVYKVNKAEITNMERPLKQICKFTIVFTCKPFKYANSGENFRNLWNNLRNPFPMESKPVYEITGNGLCEITRNGKKVSIEVTGKTYIDCELGLCYNDKNEYINSKMTGYYEDLYYEAGENIYTWTSGFTIRFKTNAIRL